MPTDASPDRLLLVGTWRAVPAHLAALDVPGRTLIVTDSDDQHACCARHRPDLMLVRASDPGAVPHAPVPWLAWLEIDDPVIATRAVAHGALSTLPAGVDADVLATAVQNALERRREPDIPRLPRAHRPGDVVRCEPDRVAVVAEGAIAVYRSYASGAESLVDVLGPGRLVPPETDLVRAVALTPARVRQHSVREARDGGWYEDHLEHDLLAARAWNQARATPHLDERILEVFGVLARNFGGVTAQDATIVDLRITHAQLAAAVGASRSAVTRLITSLRRRGSIDVTSDGTHRFVLPDATTGRELA